MTTGEPARIVANAINGGALIPNLDGRRLRGGPGARRRPRRPPGRDGPAAAALAAYVRGAVDMQGLTVRAALDQDRDAVGHAVMTDPIVQSRLTLDDAWRLTDEMIDAEAEWLPAWLGGIGSRLKEEEHAMFTDRTWAGAGGARPPRLLAALAVVALIVAACGGSTATPSAVGGRGRHRRSAAAPASPGGQRRRLHRTRRDDRVLDLGRPPGDQEPAGDRRRVPRGQPEDHRQRDRLRLGAVLGQAPDRRSPAATPRTSSRWTARCSPTTSRATSCSTSSRSSTATATT